MKLSPNFMCDDCVAIFGELRESFSMDEEEVRRNLQRMATSSGRDLEKMRDVSVASVCTVFEVEMKTVMEGHYPRTAQARGKW